MDNEQNQTSEAPAGGSANEPAAGSGQSSSEGGAGDGQGAQGDPVSGAGATVASGEGGEPAGGEPAGEAAAGEEDPNAPLELTIPEGIELAADHRTAIEAIAKDPDLTPTQRAQKIIDLGASFSKGIESAIQAQIDSNIEAWAVQSKADPEVGGTAYESNVATAQLALAKFGTPELKDALTATGFGNHPEMIRVFTRIGKAMAEAGGPQGLGNESVSTTPANPEAAFAARMEAAASKPTKPFPAT